MTEASERFKDENWDEVKHCNDIERDCPRIHHGCGKLNPGNYPY
ncbi:MAG: hypothetical protein SGI98_02180 [Verrucomicrobiota bacterium]|nr:hypothetical protein [Verrucomicrobiota bacterium]